MIKVNRNHQWFCKKHKHWVGEKYDCPYCVADSKQNQEEKITKRVERLYKKRNSFKIATASLSALTPKESKIITLHFGLKDNKFQTLQVISKMLKLSRARVWQLKQQAIKKICDQKVI